MQIKFDKKFEINFYQILEYIAQDKLSASKNFRKELFKLIKNLPNHPYKYRKSFYFNSEEIRDVTFKGYTIVYEVEKEDDCIVILNIFNRNQPM